MLLTAHLILQMKERRAPMLILTDDWLPSFFTVPVFRSSMRPERDRREHVSEKESKKEEVEEIDRQVDRHITAIVVLSGGQLFSQFVLIIGVELIIQRRAEPIRQSLVQHRRDRVRDVNHTPALARHHEEETVCCLQYQMLQLL